MNRVRTALAALACATGLLTAPAAQAAPRPVPLPGPPAAQAAATAPAAAAPCSGAYHDDARLGPARLPGPTEPPVGPLLKDYRRTGGLSPDAFLKKYWEGPADSGSWKYPPNDGFAEVNGHVDKQVNTVMPGVRLDRFGSEYGGFLAPAGDPYEKRALPPQNLNTRDASAPCDYRVYRVTKPFRAWQGSIAPWFEQPGGGRQLKLDAALLDPGTGEQLNVKWLLDHHFLAHAAA